MRRPTRRGATYCTENLFQQRKLEKRSATAWSRSSYARRPWKPKKNAAKEERLPTNDKDGRDDQTKQSERDLFNLSMLQFKFKLSSEEEKHENKIRKERKPASNEMVKMTWKARLLQKAYEKHDKKCIYKEY